MVKQPKEIEGNRFKVPYEISVDEPRPGVYILLMKSSLLISQRVEALQYVGVNPLQRIAGCLAN